MEALYMDDSYLKEFDAEVIDVKDEKFIVTNRTAFFPKGGGQLNDTGILIRKSDNKIFKVVYVGKFDGVISHEVDSPGLRKGDLVKGVIDWERRYKMMKSHTAAHIVSAVIHNETGALITGNQLELDKIRIDFNLEKFDQEKLKNFIEKANKIIEKNLKTNIRYVKMEDVKNNSSLFKLARGFAEIDELRIVSIGDFDQQADGGTHVKETKEIGKLEFLKAENKGKNNRRLYFKII